MVVHRIRLDVLDHGRNIAKFQAAILRIDEAGPEPKAVAGSPLACSASSVLQGNFPHDAQAALLEKCQAVHEGSRVAVFGGVGRLPYGKRLVHGIFC